MAFDFHCFLKGKYFICRRRMRVASEIVLVDKLIVKEVGISASVVIFLWVLNWFLLGWSVARWIKSLAGINSGVRAPPEDWRLLG